MFFGVFVLFLFDAGVGFEVVELLRDMLLVLVCCAELALFVLMVDDVYLFDE